jgi:hypothetical protein
LFQLVETGKENAILDEVGVLVKVLYDISVDKTLATMTEICKRVPSLNTKRALEWGITMGKIVEVNPWSGSDKHYHKNNEVI